MDTWDRSRETICATLNLLPAPLPGLETRAQLARYLSWTRGLIASPRVHEADAGTAMQSNLNIDLFDLDCDDISPPQKLLLAFLLGPWVNFTPKMCNRDCD